MQPKKIMNASCSGKLENGSCLSFGCACRNYKLVKKSSPNQLIVTQALKAFEARTSSFRRSMKPVTS
ncbi:hypothetical protein HPB52_022263 [Rhipicephalus sanguineus]|uniref:Uncharacterized protein n=1 Tax=Rhipicephalus sanguineus TaxID=34632 RepID=A0A9D4T0Q9_RHISA|nr:hypothetical protein HPB52_022263 [Rhipicephalus sanguineus]